MTSQGLLREARALVFVLVCLSLSVTLHTWAHGDQPPILVLMAGAGLVLSVALPLTGRQRGLPVIAAGLAVTQAGLHGLFTLVPSGGAHVMTTMPTPGTMLAAHVVAGGLTALWLYAGEVAVWGLVRWLARRMPALSVLFALVALRLLAPAPRRFRPRLAALRAPLPAPVFRRSVERRGPPSTVAVTA
ncbi:hypothetical protein [Cryptosporangium aurantiacum]|nr:hypothetical protein [Cryptosporangium aurantiacum]